MKGDAPVTKVIEVACPELGIAGYRVTPRHRFTVLCRPDSKFFLKPASKKVDRQAVGRECISVLAGEFDTFLTKVERFSVGEHGKTKCKE
jgi:hypothetical protein